MRIYRVAGKLVRPAWGIRVYRTGATIDFGRRTWHIYWREPGETPDAEALRWKLARLTPRDVRDPS